MVEITEGRLKFTFGGGWDAVKYNESRWHTGQMKSQLKAMDILATKDDRHWWIEIKDCEGYEEENRPRLSPAEPDEVGKTRIWIKDQGWAQLIKVDRKKPFIVDEVVAKFRDTLVALACAQRRAEPELVKHEIVAVGQSLTVVLILTWDSREFKRLAQRLQDKLRNALIPYAVDAYVVNEPIPAAVGLRCTIERMNI